MTSAESASPRWPPFFELVQRLREASFAPGATEFVNAGRLLRHLEEQGIELSRDALRARLRPIFCKSHDDQTRFDDAFRAWIREHEAPPTPLQDNNSSPERTLRQKLTEFYAKRHQAVWYGAALVVVLGALAVALYSRRPDFPPLPPPVPPIVSPAEAPVRETFVVPHQVEHYFPAGRSNKEVSAAIAWGGFLLPVGLLLLVGARAWVLTRSKRRNITERIILDERSLREATLHIVPHLAADIAGPLERHIRGSRTARGTLARRAPLHMRRTIEATMRNFGVPELHFRHTNLRPSYLMLIDAEDEADPRGRLFYMWANRLRLEGLDVDIRKLERREGQAPVCQPLAARGKLGDLSEPLDCLPEPPVGQRLIIVSDGSALTDAEGRLLPWVAAARFYRWRDRALFTLTEPQDWGMREQSIEKPERAADPGFLVLPLEEDALRAWARLLVSGELPNIVLSEPQRYPRLLAEGRHDFLSDDFKDKQVADRLIAQLKLYLGDNGFQWLAALAVTPVVRHPLTLLIGERFFQLAGVHEDDELRYLVARNYRRLARLPWMRRQSMPNWLRLRLLHELPELTQDRIRDVVRSLLQPLVPTEGSGIAVELDALPDGHGARVPVCDAGIAIYQGYMSGLSTRQLAMRIPEAWAAWIRKHRVQPSRRRGGWRISLDTARDWLVDAWSELAFRSGLAHKRVHSVLWIVLVGLVLMALILIAVQLQKISSGNGMLLSDEYHPITYELRGTRLTAIAFSTKGKHILTGGDDGRVQNWTVSNGDHVGKPMFHPMPVVTLAFCGPGDIAVTATGDGTLRFWNTARGVQQRKPLPQTGYGIHSVACDPSGRYLVATYDVGTVSIWDLRAKKETKMSRRLTGAVYAAAFVGNTRTVVIAASDGLSYWNAPYKDDFRLVEKWEGTVDNAMISLDGNIVLAVGPDIARLWDLANPTPIGQATSHGSIAAAALSPDGTQFLIADDRRIALWRAGGHTPMKEWWNYGAPVSDVAFSPDGQHLVIGYADHATLWSGDKTAFPVPSMDLDSAHGFVSTQMTAHPVVTTALCLLAIALVVWLYVRALRRDVLALSAT